jgi:DNA-binding MarR family transcriptional regulator
MTIQLSKELPTECALFNVKRAGRVMSKIYGKRLSAVGLKGAQFAILSVLNNHKEITYSLTAELLSMDRTSVTRALKPLERDGFVDIAPGKEDRRIRYISITTKGTTLFKNAMPFWEQAQTEFLEHMGDGNWKELKDLLEKAKCIQI